MNGPDRSWHFQKFEHLNGIIFYVCNYSSKTFVVNNSNNKNNSTVGNAGEQEIGANGNEDKEYVRKFNQGKQKENSTENELKDDSSENKLRDQRLGDGERGAGGGSA